MRNFAPSMDNTGFTSAILAWFARNGRELPWRGIGDPYAIWLSEIILQQTRISQGTAYWHRFMSAYPTVESLAAATEDEVLKLWQGLGYYSRARNLHAAAKSIAAMGAFPDRYEDIRRLKGVGDYTAAAIASMAFGLPYAAVDGNVYRVLARHYGIGTPINTTQGKRQFQLLADELCPQRQAGTWNQAMMDFGALQCTPQSPACATCPLAETCEAYRNGHPEAYPVKEQKMKRRTRYLTYYYIARAGRVLFHRRPAGDIWQGLWEPVVMESTDKTIAQAPDAVKHVLTHQTLYARMVPIDASDMPTDAPLPYGLPSLATLGERYHWATPQEIEGYALPRLVDLLIERLAAQRT